MYSIRRSYINTYMKFLVLAILCSTKSHISNPPRSMARGLETFVTLWDRQREILSKKYCNENFHRSSWLLTFDPFVQTHTFCQMPTSIFFHRKIINLSLPEHTHTKRQNCQFYNFNSMHLLRPTSQLTIIHSTNRYEVQQISLGQHHQSPY